MDSDESRDGSGDAQSPSSSSSSSSTSSHSRRSSSSDKSDGYKNDHSKGPKSPAQSPPSIRPSGPRSPSPESGSQSPSLPVPQLDQPPSPNNVGRSGSNVDSPEDRGQSGPKSPDPPKSPSVGSDIGSPDPAGGGEGPKTPGSPDSSKSGTAAQEPMSGPGSPDFASQADSPRKQIRSPSSSPSPDRHRHSPPQVQEPVRNEWSPKEKWRRHTKAEQKMVAPPRERSGSESSQSSRSSSYNKRTSTKDPATEEISEGEMESDQEDNKSRTSRASRSKSRGSDKVDSKDHNISHEDLSDVSDLDSNEPEELEKSHKPKSPPVSPEHNVNGKDASTHSSPKSDSAKLEPPKLEKVPQEKTSNTEDGEEQLDFEAEEGECVEPKEVTNGDVERPHIERVTFEDTKPIRRSRGSSLEEGEVSDEGERRPEESEPRPVCRFFSRGACTWGISCRFLHPGVTDKGNYNMFEVVRGLPPGPTPARDVPPPESAWERGLRTAKEMLRIANKRKEQDMDFEEKKLHLSVGGVVHDPDAELAYAAAAVGASPPPRPDAPPRDPEMYRNPVPRGYPAPPMYRGRYRPAPPDERYERGYERERAYERGYERAPQYDERVAMQDEAYQKRRIRPSREVIVQRPVEPERRELRREPRGDEWADPWMRAEPAARKRKPPSSEDSCSSSSSRSSRSPGSRRKRRASESSRLRLSPSVIVRERRLATARATAMNPPAPRRRAASPAAARQMAVNPPPPASHRHKEEIDPYGRSKASSRNRDRKKYSRSSSSGSESSSSSSESESESRSSSTSGSSGARRARHARLLNAAARPLSMNVKNATLAAAVTSMGKKEPFDKDPAKKRGATSPISGGAPAKKSVSRREELLKQLKAVEDAIARKRSKI